VTELRTQGFFFSGSDLHRTTVFLFSSDWYCLLHVGRYQYDSLLGCDTL